MAPSNGVRYSATSIMLVITDWRRCRAFDLLHLRVLERCAPARAQSLPCHNVDHKEPVADV